MHNDYIVVSSDDIYQSVREFDTFEQATEWISILIRNACIFSVSYRAR